MKSNPAIQLMSSGPVLPSIPRVSQTLRLSVAVLGLVLIVAGSIALAQFIKDPLRFPVTHVDVLGTLDYENRDALMQSVNSYTTQGFYGLDIDDVRRSVEVLPWIAGVRVSRVWPSRIEVRIEEHEPAARWNDDSLMSKKMVMFKPPQLQPDNPRYTEWRNVFASLPQLRGAEGRHSALLDSFRAYELELQQFDVGLRVLDEDERGSQNLELTSDVIVRLGYEHRELRMQRFLDVYTRIMSTVDQQSSPVTFDMRYSNGFSLGGVVPAQLRGELPEKPLRLVQGPLQ